MQIFLKSHISYSCADRDWAFAVDNFNWLRPHAACILLQNQIRTSERFCELLSSTESRQFKSRPISTAETLLTTKPSSSQHAEAISPSKSAVESPLVLSLVCSVLLNDQRELTASKTGREHSNTLGSHLCKPRRICESQVEIWRYFKSNYQATEFTSIGLIIQRQITMCFEPLRKNQNGLIAYFQLHSSVKWAFTNAFWLLWINLSCNRQLFTRLER